MKKLICVLLLGISMSACSDSKTGTMTCESKVDNEQMKSFVKQSLDYENETVIKQVNETQLTMPNADGYEQIIALVNNAEFIYKQMQGTTYTHEEDKAKFFISEKVELDLKNMSQEDIEKVISYETSNNMNINKIKEALESQGYTCKK